MKNYIIFFLLLCSINLIGQEICDNAIDDDGDGLVDLNDDDCKCKSLIASSLIPNPSFEEMSCCPNSNAELDCAVAWIQASEATTDYVHTCSGYLGNNNFNPPAVAPLPFPDGEGGVGFRDGQANAGPNYKEYVGACLNDVMEVGKTYRFDFFVGFRANQSSSSTLNMAIFGSTNCSNLPFGGGIFAVGCPTNTSGYVQLGELTVSGNNEWKNVVFEFEADLPYTTIVLGPSCSGNPNHLQNPYFYLDNLALEESAKFGVPFEEISGSICQNNLLLSLQSNPAHSYQWYFNGVAMLGETNATLLLTASDNLEGTYMGIITTPDGCLASKEYELRIPPYYTNQIVNLCEGDSYIFLSDTLSTSGTYEQTTSASDGCDSIITLTLNLFEEGSAILRDTFCVGDTFNLFDISATESGTYQTTITNSKGCDSTITLELSTVGLQGGLQLADSLVLELGERRLIRPLYIDPIYTDVLWTDNAGNTLSTTPNIEDFQAIQNSILYLEATDIYGCSAADTVALRIIPNYNLYVPNIFTPEAALDNQFFRFYAPISLESVLNFQVFDRWGSLVFEDSHMDFGLDYIGWDGQVRGKRAASGVYTWLLKARFLDGTVRVLVGDVTLLR